MSDMVECCEHGQRRSAYVCRCIVDGLKKETPTGFIWSRDENNSINAYCSECDDMLENEFGGDWENVPKERYHLAILCESCAIDAAKLSDVEIDR